MFPALNSQQRQSARGSDTSRKVPLKPGRSLVDWIRLTKSGKDLKGTGPRLLRITTEELAKHNKPNDLWMALRGMVYNVSQYIEYHPGGADELMKGAGKDATSLFEKVHRWVNYESMLRECLVGKLVEVPHQAGRNSYETAGMLAVPPPVLQPPPVAAGQNLSGVNALKINSSKPTNLGVPQIKLQDIDDDGATSSGISLEIPTPANHAAKKELPVHHDWYQTQKTVVFIIYTKCSQLETCQIVCDIQNGKELLVDVLIGGTLHVFNIKLEEDICDNATLNVTKSGKAQVTVTKMDSSIRWRKIGSIVYSPVSFSKRNVSKMRFVNCTIETKSDLTHDTSLYHVKLPLSRWMKVPIGYHVYIKSSLEGVEIWRPYTPVSPCLLHEKAESLLSSGQDLYLAIKHYSNGALTSTLTSKKAGDSLLLSTYDGDFDFAEAKKFQSYIMLAAGTGITPMVRVLYEILHDHDNKQICLLYFNKEERDIIYRVEFDKLEENFKGRFKFENVLSRPGDSWPGRRGRISSGLIQDYLETVDMTGKEDLFFFVCGPNEFTKLGIAILDELGFRNKHAFT